MRSIKIFFTLLVLFIWAFDGSAQQRLLQGMVTTFDSIPLIGAEVKIKSSKQVIETDTLGRFNAFVEPDEKLKVENGEWRLQA